MRAQRRYRSEPLRNALMPEAEHGAAFVAFDRVRLLTRTPQRRVATGQTAGIYIECQRCRDDVAVRSRDQEPQSGAVVAAVDHLAGRPICIRMCRDVVHHGESELCHVAAVCGGGSIRNLASVRGVPCVSIATLIGEQAKQRDRVHGSGSCVPFKWPTVAGSSRRVSGSSCFGMLQMPLQSSHSYHVTWLFASKERNDIGWTRTLSQRGQADGID